MALTYGFYNSIKGDRKYDAMQFSEIIDTLIIDGIIPNQGQLFAVNTAGTGMQVTVGTGFAWFFHSWTKNDSMLILNVSESDISRPRIDAVVLEVNRTDPVRANSIKIIKGEPNVNAEKPVLVNTDAVRQYPLAYITVPASAEEIKAENIESMIGREPTVFATGVLETVPLDELWNQWEGEWDTWFDSIKLQLSENVVANLQFQIENKVDIADKATEEDVISPTSNTKWMTPVRTQQMIEGNSEEKREVGDIRWSGRNLELETNGEYIACDGRIIFIDNYPEYKKNVYYKFGFFMKKVSSTIALSNTITIDPDDVASGVPTNGVLVTNNDGSKVATIIYKRIVVELNTINYSVKEYVYDSTYVTGMFYMNGELCMHCSRSYTSKISYYIYRVASGLSVFIVEGNLRFGTLIGMWTNESRAIFYYKPDNSQVRYAIVDDNFIVSNITLTISHTVALVIGKYCYCLRMATADEDSYWVRINPDTQRIENISDTEQEKLSTRNPPQITSNNFIFKNGATCYYRNKFIVNWTDDGIIENIQDYTVHNYFNDSNALSNNMGTYFGKNDDVITYMSQGYIDGYILNGVLRNNNIDIHASPFLHNAMYFLHHKVPNTYFHVSNLSVIPFIEYNLSSITGSISKKANFFVTPVDIYAGTFAPKIISNTINTNPATFIKLQP